jgi:ribosome-associated translation inhibitor RaiA
MMLIQVNTGRNISGTDNLEAWVKEDVESALARFSNITRVEVHLNDEDAVGHSPNDKRCLLEARLGGSRPVAASDQADTLRAAVRGASRKLQRLLDSELGKRRG